MKILVVEDDADQRDLIRETLDEHFGPDTVVPTACGREALAQSLDKFDIILTDFNLPDITGIDLLARILSRCDKPVIVVTGENVRQSATQAIRTGASDYLLKAGDYLTTIPLAVEKNIESYKIRQENRRLQEQQQQSAREIALKNQQLKDSLQQMERMAATDPLTGLYNRRHFTTCLQRCFEETQRYGQDLSCIMLDLDGYKHLNDELGHQFGDRILQITAKVITLNLRVMDIAARYGGDEFVVLLPHIGADTAVQAGQRVKDEFMAQMRNLLPSDVSMSMSMGVATVSVNHPSHAEQLVAYADDALYAAKRAGKNCIVDSTANTVGNTLCLLPL